MSSESDTRAAIRDWIVRTNGKIQPQDLDDGTPIIEQRIITSVQVMDLILFLESLTGRPIDVARLRAGVFRNVDAIFQNFCADSAGS